MVQYPSFPLSINLTITDEAYYILYIKYQLVVHSKITLQHTSQVITGPRHYVIPSNKTAYKPIEFLCLLPESQANENIPGFPKNVPSSFPLCVVGSRAILHKIRIPTVGTTMPDFLTSNGFQAK